jgi:hypothetical protein
MKVHKCKGKIVPVHAMRYVEGREVEQHPFLTSALGVCDQQFPMKFK